MYYIRFTGLLCALLFTTKNVNCSFIHIHSFIHSFLRSFYIKYIFSFVLQFLWKANGRAVRVESSSQPLVVLKIIPTGLYLSNSSTSAIQQVKRTMVEELTGMTGMSICLVLLVDVLEQLKLKDTVYLLYSFTVR